MIYKILWGLLYLIACLMFFNELKYALLSNIVLSIGITALLSYVVYGLNRNIEKVANSLNYYAVLFLINIMGPMISSTEEMLLERPFLILSFYYGLYLVVQYCFRKGFKLSEIIPAAILSSSLFCLAQRWTYIPFTCVSVLLGWWNYSNKTKS